MIQFFKTIDGEWINADRIERIAGALITLSDGSLVAPDAAYKGPKLGRALAPVISAAPGFFRLRCYVFYDFDEDEPQRCERLPIVAWRVAQHKIYPVVPGGDNDAIDCLVNGEAVLLPDGRVIELSGTIFLNETTWLTAIHKRSAAKAREEAVEAAKTGLVLSDEEGHA